jgi:hypothetical protein
VKLLRSASAIVAACAAALTVSLALADDRRVLLIGPSSTHPTVVRVQQELELLGLDVEIATPAPSADLATLAREHGAAAVARVEDWPPEIVVWVGSAAGGGSSQETRVSQSLSGSTEPGLLAHRAVELLRGRLLPVPKSANDGGTAPGSTLTPTPTPTPTAAAAVQSASATTAAERGPPAGPPARPPRASLHLGPALVLSPGGVPAAPALRVGGGWRAFGPVELDGFAMLPLAAATVTAAEGQVDLRVLAFGAGASVLFTQPSSALAVRAGGGLGAAAFFFEGRATAPWVSASGNGWSALPFVAVGAGYRFTPLLAVRADFLAALARPEPLLVMAGRAVAAFGSPAVFASIALEVLP